LELAARTFFAQKDMITPLYIAAGAGVVNVLLGLLLMRLMGHGGLALANSLAVTAEVIVLLYVLHRRIGGVEAGQILQVFGRVLVASVVMGAVVIAVMRLGGALVPGLILVAAAGAAGLLAFIVAGLLLGVQTLYRLPVALLGRK
jgi:putative peptidoglycan lipid II flippase